MKKSKLLIPALSIASVGAVVAPMLTSCSKEAMVTISDFNFTPDKKHDPKQITSQAELDALVKEYFENPMYFAQDFAYLTLSHGPLQMKKTFQTAVENGYIKDDYTYSFKIEIKNISASPKEITLQSNADATKGYLLNGSMYFEYEYSIETTEKGREEGGSDLQFKKKTVKNSSNQNLNNIFFYINPNMEYGETGIKYGAMMGCGYNQLDWSASNTTTETQTKVSLNDNISEEHSTVYDIERRQNVDEKSVVVEDVTGIAVQKLPEAYSDVPSLYYFSEITYNM